MTRDYRLSYAHRVRHIETDRPTEAIIAAHARRVASLCVTCGARKCRRHASRKRGSGLALDRDP